MPQHCDLGFQLRLRSERLSQHVDEQLWEVEHRALP
jgi:hypothetical protein